jgi:uncharacterized SAM-binding protein YcdF (DUF218 family)
MSTEEYVKDKWQEARNKGQVWALGPCLFIAPKRCLLTGAVFLAVGLMAVGVFVIRLGHFLTVDDTLSRADAIVVLGGGNSSRAQHAVALFSQGYAPLVVFSGGTLKDVGLACSSAQLSLEAAQRLGLPANVSIIGPEAQSTYDEAVNLQQMAQEHGWRFLIVVTEPLHTRRAARTFRTLLPEVDIHVSAAPNPRYDPAHWWESEHGLVGVCNEVLKLGFYWAKYGIRPF